MCFSTVCPSHGCRSVWLKGTPNGSGLLPSPQTAYATAKLINTEFIELYFRDLSVSPTVLSRFLAHAPVAEKPRFEKKKKICVCYRILTHAPTFG